MRLNVRLQESNRRSPFGLLIRWVQLPGQAWELDLPSWLHFGHGLSFTNCTSSSDPWAAWPTRLHLRGAVWVELVLLHFLGDWIQHAVHGLQLVQLHLFLLEIVDTDVLSNLCNTFFSLLFSIELLIFNADFEIFDVCITILFVPSCCPFKQLVIVVFSSCWTSSEYVSAFKPVVSSELKLLFFGLNRLLRSVRIVVSNRGEIIRCRHTSIIVVYIDIWLLSTVTDEIEQLEVRAWNTACLFEAAFLVNFNRWILCLLPFN